MKNALAFVLHPGNLNIDGAFLDGVWRTGARSNEERLMLAVLEDAIDLFFRYLRAKEEKGRENFQEVERWILQKNSNWIFSFENVCDYLGISTSYLRAELVRRKEGELRRRPMVHCGEERTVAAGGG
jgi:hypothetical protein